MKKRLLVLVLLGAGMEALLLLLTTQPSQSVRIAEVAATLLFTSIFYIVAAFLVLKESSPPRDSRLLLAVVLLFALAFRLTAWQIPPFLSDDIYRYRWEGKLQAAGGNPYHDIPNDPAWAQLRDETFPLVVGKDFRAAYGPFIELLQWVVWRLASGFTSDPHAQVPFFRLPAAIFDILTIIALAGLLRARSMALDRLLIYGWCPPVIVEFWAMGHNDAVALFLLAAALWLAARERWKSAFTLLALAGAAKLWPLALAPLFIGWDGWRPRRMRQSMVVLPVLWVASIPYLDGRWPALWDHARFVSGFMGGWRNNDSLFGGLLWLSGDLYRAKYAAFALLALVIVWVALRQWPLEKGCLAVIAAMLLLSANCHPWYLTWLIPLLPLVPFVPVFLWVGLAPLAYKVMISWRVLGEWHGSTPHRWLIYAPVFALLGFELAWRWCRRKRAVQLS